MLLVREQPLTEQSNSGDMKTLLAIEELHNQLEMLSEQLDLMMDIRASMENMYALMIGTATPPKE